MKILYAIETLEMGGAEKFVVEVANASSSYNDTFLFVIYHKRINKTLQSYLSNKVTIVSKSILFDFFLQKIDSIFFHLNLPLSIRALVVKNILINTIKKYQVDIIHSNQFNVDNICLKASVKTDIPVISTIHGDYLNFYKKFIKSEKVYGSLNFESKLRFNLKHLKTIVCISDEQISFFNDLKTKGYKVNEIKKIYNGISNPVFLKKNKASVGLNEDTFVFGMVARGIPEKGWQIAIDAFLQLKIKNTTLILVGDSPYLKTLKQSYDPNPNIIFTGFSINPAEWIQHFDVGILPSTYQSESLPTSIIEYLAQGKPVIATDIGEIRNMLSTKEGTAGILVPKDENTVEYTAEAIKKMINDPQTFDNYKSVSSKAFKKFNMTKCSKEYLKICENLLT